MADDAIASDWIRSDYAWTVTVAVFSSADVRRAVAPAEAYEAVREAFVAHARGEWTMQPKLYVTNYPAGDFRAMPALGGGHALLKWVTSFPGNPEIGLPTVTGLVVLSDAETGTLQAVLDAGAVTALRTGAAAVLAAVTLGRGGPIAVVGCGVNGAAAAETFSALGLELLVYDRDPGKADAVARETGAAVAGSQEEALAANIVVTVTPGRETLYRPGSLRPGQHVSLMGADGPGKAEIAVEELGRGRVFCDDWEQASHGGELAAALAVGALRRDDVTELGRVLNGEAEGRRHNDEITLFDSTGLAIQDLAIARLAWSRADGLDVARLSL
jgi:ornithine cyclodeaminase/alanine dehydrogenase-like protein (mu-crystallin family)